MKSAWCALILMLVALNGYCGVSANDVDVVRNVTNTNVVVVGKLLNQAADSYQLSVSDVIYDRDMLNIDKGQTIPLHEDVSEPKGPASVGLREYAGETVIAETTCAYDGNDKFACYVSGFDGQVVSQDISGVTEKWQERTRQVSSWAGKFDSIAPHDTLMEEKVLRLVIELEYPHTGQTAADELIAMGQHAVPYIVRFMKDFHVYPDQALRLENPKGSFESTRFYRPDLVIDALNDVLGQITGQSFGEIYSGTPYVTERMAVLAAWRAYGYLLLSSQQQSTEAGKPATGTGEAGKQSKADSAEAPGR